MDNIEFDKLLLKTSFCCLASDGKIDQQEIDILRLLFCNKEQYKNINFDEKINSFIRIYNEKEKDFFTFYFDLLKESNLSKDEELILIDVAIKTIKADHTIEYSEIKFFKNIRHRLKLSNEEILEVYPDIEEFLEEDIINESALDRITNQFLNTANLPKLDMIKINID